MNPFPPPPPPSGPVPWERGFAQRMLAGMVRIRRMEEKCAELYGQQKIRGFLHLYIGEEPVAVGAMAALRDEDNVVATYREHGHALVRGVPMTQISPVRDCAARVSVVRSRSDEGGSITPSI